MTKKYSIKDEFDKRFNSVEKYHNKLKSFVENRDIRLYIHGKTHDRELKNPNKDYKEFFKQLYKKDSIPNIIFEYIMKETWVKEISFIWYKNKRELGKIPENPVLIVSPRSDQKQLVKVHYNRRCKKIKVYIFEL